MGLEKIVPWREIADNYNNDDLERIRKEHEERLNRYRNRKEWEAWVEEDELDIEGDRILLEIKLYKPEFFFKMYQGK